MTKLFFLLLASNSFINCFSQTSEEYYARGIAKSDIGKNLEAIADYSMAIKLNPNFSSAYLNRGVSKVALKKYSEAILDYNKALEIEPKSADIYYDRGTAKTYLKDAQGALTDFTMAIESDSNFYYAYYNRGVIKSELKEYVNAILDFTKAIMIVTNSQQESKFLSQAYYDRGNANHRLNKLKEAMEDYSKAIELNPKLDQAFGNRAIINSLLLNFQEAIDDDTKAIALNPKDGSYYLIRGMAKYQLNQKENACIDFHKASELREKNANEMIKIKCRNAETILHFNTQTLATWDDKKNDWFRDWPRIACDATITLSEDSTIKLYFKVLNTNKVSTRLFKWNKILDKNMNGRLWTNYTLNFDKNSEFFFINLEKDNNNKIADALFINDKSMLIFFNQ